MKPNLFNKEKSPQKTHKNNEKKETTRKTDTNHKFPKVTEKKEAKGNTIEKTHTKETIKRTRDKRIIAKKKDTRDTIARQHHHRLTPNPSLGT